MLFCGQCGLRLNTGEKQSPRCGTPVEPGLPIVDDVPQDAPTVASPSLLGQMQTQAPATPDMAGDQQKLILRPEQTAGNANYGTQGAYEPTRRVQSPEGTAPSYPDVGHLANQPTQYSQGRGNYPPQQDMYAEYPPSSENYAPQGAPYPNYAPQGMGYQGYPGPQIQARPNTKGRNTALLVILLGLLLVLIAMTLFILEHNGVFGSSNTTGTSTVTGVLTPEQQAQALVQHYYDDINQKNFSAASLLWQESQRPDPTSFGNGFKNTLHDDIAFTDVKAQSDGTVKVSVTLNATVQADGGQRTNNMYTGSYIVGPQNGTWQLLQGSLKRA